MNIFAKVVRDKIKLFILAVALITIFGGLYVQTKYQKQQISFPKEEALEGVIKLSSPKIKVTEDIYNESKIYKSDLTITLKNNTDETLTGVKFVMGNKGLGYLESPSAIRFSHLLPRENEIIFSLADLPPKGKGSGKISIYAQEPGVYLIKTDVVTDQKIRATSNTINSVTLTAE